MKKIKIARIVTIPFTLISLLNLFDELEKDESFELHIICNTDRYLEFLKKRYKKCTFHIIDIQRQLSVKNDFKCLIQLIKIFKKEKFSIVHSHTPKAGILTALAGLVCKSPVRIHTFTGQVWVDYEGFKRMFFIAIDKIIYSLNSINYVDGLSQKEFLIHNKIGSNNKLKVLNRGSLAGIDLNKFNPKLNEIEILNMRNQLFPNFTGKVILFLGRINNDKGILELGKAFLELKKRYSVKLLIVGPIENVSNELENLLKALREDQDVCFKGFVTNTEIYLGLCDIFCLPSYREGCPTSVLEASAMMKPVVVSNIYGTKDIVIDSETGLFFKVKNEEDLYNKLEKIINDDEFAKKLGLNGKEFVEANFSNKILTEKMILEYKNYYRES